MRKLKIPFLIFGTLGLLALFALLPKIVSSIMDNQEKDSPSYTDLIPIQLDITTERNRIPVLDKLAILSRSKAIDITQDQMTMNEDAVTDAVSAFLYQCEAAGIFQPFEPSTVSMQPKLLYDLTDPAKHIFVWTVTMLYKKEPNQVLRMDVDDETGQILSITYGNYQEYTMDGVWERNKTVVDAITDIYFSQLGLYEVAEKAENAEELIYEGEYTSYDTDEPMLYIQKNEDGTYNIQIGIYRLIQLDHCVGVDKGNQLEFSTMELGENQEITGTIILTSDVATVTLYAPWSDTWFKDVNEFNYYSTTGEGSYKYAEVDGGVTEAVYVFTTPLFGKFFAQFTVDGAGGFSISFYE